MLKIDKIYPTIPKKSYAEDKKKLLDLIKQFKIEIIAIGNGTASRESESFVSNMIKENLIRKYKSIYGVVPEDDNFHIVPMDKSKIRKMIVNYKSTVIVGWKADFKLTGNPEMIRIALLAGIGARNSIGMGMLLQV